ncbi:MAG: T9SS type A sorting domain-containing protein [Bacteroidia bacterium]|nr:T9SS type A sorting domain-containing protein [Bacteroidia bacterium]
MKTLSPFKFIITIVMVMVIFSTTVNSQTDSAQINAISDFSDYNQTVQLGSITPIQNGFNFNGNNGTGKFSKNYNSQYLDSVKVSFKINATFLLDNSGSEQFGVRVIDPIFTLSPTVYTTGTTINSVYQYIYEYTFKNGDSVLFNNCEIAINGFYAGTITVDSLIIKGYKQTGTIWTETSTSAEESEISISNFNTYPNPNNGEFNILFESKLISSPIKIYDTQGRMIYENHDLRQIGENTLNIQLENISPGVYSLNSGEKTYKIVIVK